MADTNRSLRILGLDPGSRYTGFGVIDRQGSRLEVIEHGRIAVPSDQPMHSRLAYLAAQAENLLARVKPRMVALESLFRGVNTRSLIVLSQARGALLATLGDADIELFEYSPAEIKSAVTGSGRADKEQVSRMVQMILGLRGATLSSDASDALAVAICLAQRLRLDRLGGGGHDGRGATRGRATRAQQHGR